MTKDEALKLALEALENNKQMHYYCEDTWYSCPQHEEGCANDSVGDECNCGADKANAEIDKVITAIKEALAQPEQETPKGWKSEIWKFVKQQEQEPVTWGVDWGKAGDIPCVSIIKRLPDGGIKVLAVEYAPYSYTTPPQPEHFALKHRIAELEGAVIGLQAQRTWVALTDEERKNIMIECESTGDWAWELKAAQAIEAKLKEKNT